MAAIAISAQAQSIAPAKPVPVNPAGSAPRAEKPKPQIVERGPHHRLWQWTEWQTNAQGQAMARKHSYTELATGLHYKDANGEWVEAKELIEPSPEGAIAQYGRHQVVFAANLNTEGGIRLRMPDGKELRSHILGLCYFDTSNSNQVVLAEVKDCLGQIVQSNQVVYADAFTGVKADVRYTYRKSGLEQDVILRTQLPAPERFGLQSASTRLQVLTEFLDPPKPKGQPRSASGKADEAQELNFGPMTMRKGKAFDLGQGKAKGINVSKQFELVDGRNILTESVPLRQILPHLSRLPEQSSVLRGGTKDSSPRKASARLVLPRNARALQSSSQPSPMVVAGVSPRPGFVLDWETVETQDELVLQDDTTYLVQNLLFVNHLILEGGTVVKYAEPTETINAWTVTTILSVGTLDCKTDAYRPALFTAADDDSVGERIEGSTGTPSGYYADSALYLNGGNFHNARFSYVDAALCIGNPNDSTTNIISDVQFTQVGVAIQVSVEPGSYAPGPAPPAHVAINNALFSAVGQVLDGNNQASGTHLTVDNCGALGEIHCTNSVIANLATPVSADVDAHSDYNGFYNSPAFGAHQFTSADTPFQTVGAGAYYLVDGSSFRNVGTPAIDASLLAALGQKTTYPPLVYPLYTQITNDTLFVPQVPRDMLGADLGYHYDPIDYILAQTTASAPPGATTSVTVAPGTVIAGIGHASSDYALGIGDRAALLCQGTPLNPVRFVAYNAVQESPIASQTQQPQLIKDVATVTMTGMNLRFTQLSGPAQDFYYLTSDSAVVNLQDCELHGGILVANTNTLNLTNCLLERASTHLYSRDGNVPVICNNTFFGGVFEWGINTLTNMVLKHNVFAQTAIANDDSPAQGYNGGWNAFVANCARLLPTNSADILLPASPAYQAGPLGNYYLPGNSSLINAGSLTNAGLVGLCHYTTTTNQVLEGGTPLDIGYHYVALDAQGHPVDSGGLGVPDYLADPNCSSGSGAPVLTSQPASHGADEGTDTSFSVAAAGSHPLSYQWRFNGNNLPGMTTASLNLTAVQAAQEGTYSVVVSNAVGTVTSADAVLTVIPASWLVQYFGTIFQNNPDAAPGADPDGDGLTNLQEYQLGTDPTDYYNNSLPLLTVVGGDRQTGNAGAILPTPLVVQVSKPDGTPLTNAPLCFSVVWGGGRLLLSTNVLPVISLPVRTDTDGRAMTYLQLPSNSGNPNLIRVTAQSGGNPVSVNFSESVLSPMISGNTEDHGLVVQPNGGVLAWGTNRCSSSWYAPPSQGGMFGDFTFLASDRLVHTIERTNIVKVVSDYDASFALEGNGTLWAWGHGWSGAFAEPTSLATNRPIQVTSFTNVIDVASYYEMVGAVLRDGTAWTWGSTLSPIPGGSEPQQLDGISNAMAITCGWDFVLVLLQDGTVMAMGRNGAGALGTGDYRSRSAPVPVPGLSNIVALAAGNGSSFALQSNGVIWAWGNNRYGQLGVGEDSWAIPTPTQVVNLTHAVAMSSGYAHTLALDTQGYVWAWGDNWYGQLGIGDDDVWGTNQPVQVPGLSNIVSIAACDDSCFALESNGTVWAWGAGFYWDGQTNRPSPVLAYQDFCGGIPPLVQVLSGNNQTGYVGTSLAQPIVFSVTDTNGQPLAGAPVSIEMPAGYLDCNGLNGLRTNADANGQVSLPLFAEAIGSALDVKILAASQEKYSRLDFTVNVLADVPPSIVIIFPTNGVIVLGSNQTANVTVAVSVVDSPVQTVNFMDGTVSLGTSSASPFSFVWTNVPAGPHTLTATAVDGVGLASSASVTFTVPYDSDGNGLPDRWQWLYFGHLGVDPNGEPAGDGVNNYLKYLLGLNPFVSAAPPPDAGVHLQVYTPLR